MRIGVDIDNVIADFELSFRNKLNKRYNLNLVREDIVNFHFYKCPKISPYVKNAEEENTLINEFIEEKGFRTLDQIPGSIKALELLAKDHSIILITSRKEESTSKDTDYWIQCNSMSDYELVFENDKAKCSDLIDLMVEDSMKHAMQVAKCNKKVFLIDYPWNRNPSEVDNILRVKNWDEIVEIIKGGSI